MHGAGEGAFFRQNAVRGQRNHRERPDILRAILVASKAMRAKKLLDRESIHSEMLTSLIRALQECDSDTEHHVRRTQQMGAALGKS